MGFLENTTRHNVELDVMDETEAELLFCNPSHGSMPQAANEVVASDAALEDLGSQAEVGAPVTIQFTARGQTYTLDMVVSGWYEATNDQVSTMVVGTAFRDAYPDLFQNTFATDREMVGTYWSDIVATSTVGLQDAMDDWGPQRRGRPGGRQRRQFPARRGEHRHQPHPLPAGVGHGGGPGAPLHLLRVPADLQCF